jgi:hypothetical protein
MATPDLAQRSTSEGVHLARDRLTDVRAPGVRIGVYELLSNVSTAEWDR